jgi:hypothetical protein
MIAGTESVDISGLYSGVDGVAWNIHIDDSLSASLANFQLSLYERIAGGGSISIAVSNNTIDNTQNIFATDLSAADTYELEVTQNPNQICSVAMLNRNTGVPPVLGAQM